MITIKKALVGTMSAKFQVFEFTNIENWLLLSNTDHLLQDEDYVDYFTMLL
jgi:hypothetical protein